MFKGLRTFNELLAAGEGIASNILADRLARLEAAAILTKEADPSDARRFNCRLTAKGMDLAPALIEIILWAARYESTVAPPAALRAMRERRTQVIADLRQRWAAR